MAVYQVRLLNEAEDLDVTLEVDEDEFILDVAEDEEIKLPFSCRAGTCSTCTGRVIEGDVKEQGGNPEMFFNSSDSVKLGFDCSALLAPSPIALILTHQEPNISKF
jgi:ferredoxin